ncbi:acetyl-CoA synthetase-like protein [Trichoderma longibrachiatum ATCC 18648]|uniref:Acetyl-CoA synthetase-like protein n=1 Tax=Trichoderma longibrachiatum ATCC 18648 TaxID=983965 RepID=A0A2T4BX88_TRILO|nr:acetyl-CoA synthetase-like protein [Trichoderma longibrachiatum ATCC 18648]
MPVPLPILLPAAAASLAYLNAKSSFWYDLALVKSVVKASLRVRHGLNHDTINLFYALESAALSRRLANKPFLIFEGKTHTYAQTYDRVLRYGHWIRKRFGVKPQEIVAMDFENSDTFIFVWFALWSIGAKPAFINYNLSGKPLAHCIKAATTRLCLIDPAVASKFEDESVKQSLPNVEFVVFTPEVEAEALATAPERAFNTDRSDGTMASMAMLIYTSGTTGLPKPAVVSWAKCIYGGTMAATLLNRGNGDIMYTCMPLYHSSAALLSVCATLLSGSTQALGRKFSTKRFWDECRASKATSIQYVGETLRYLLAAPPQLDPITGEDLDRKHNPGQPGEMLYRLPADDIGQRFQGYFNNPGASDAKILRSVFRPGDAWFRSGDVLRCDADGLTYFSDRIGDTFRWKSENVSTAEVSQAVGLHPAVREANVYGVELPHHDGRAGCAAVCLDPPVPDEATLRSLAAHVRASLPRYAQPLFLRLVRDVGVGSQTTGTNKQQKQSLRAEGVRPRETDVYWLRGDSYVPFREKDWRELEGGRVKL